MYSRLINDRQVNLSELPACEENFIAHHDIYEQQKSFLFRVSYLGSMEMYSDADTVADYLNAHEGWFCRCAQPMKVEPINDNGYILTVGCFNSLGYEVEPKIAIVLNPPIDRVYTMKTIPVTNYNPPGYEVNYRASMELKEKTREENEKQKPAINFLKNQNKKTIPNITTQVNWTMNLAVKVKFPKFIYKLSPSLIQSTGDRLLGQIIRQISPRLTYKVQQDFHTRYNLPIPPKNTIKLEKVSVSE
ncbi:MAG: DUF1997 domain-containing protein [Xenococcaceae cyanobacterium MO_188.B32]|nr:DUF1997 domain-containing protein [Xenococcaceae cyanobacterium MO_188.B32]